MDPLCDLHSRNKHYREEALREAQERHRLLPQRSTDRWMPIGGTFRLGIASVFVAVLVTVLLGLAAAKLAQAPIRDEAVPDNHGPIAFEKDGDIWVATKMHLANITPHTADSTETDPAVSPDGTYVAFVSDRDGDYEIYVASVFTGEAEHVTNNKVADRQPAWSVDGHWISYQSSHYASPTNSGIFLASVERVTGLVRVDGA
jgi:dipeptidyl aminopeptidase/acylaminoacyl peptidase